MDQSQRDQDSVGPAFPMEDDKERGVWKSEWGDQELRKEVRGQVWNQPEVGEQIQEAEKHHWDCLQYQSHLLLIQKMRVVQGELLL